MDYVSFNVAILWMGASGILGIILGFLLGYLAKAGQERDDYERKGD